MGLAMERHESDHLAIRIVHARRPRRTRCSPHLDMHTVGTHNTNPSKSVTALKTRSSRVPRDLARTCFWGSSARIGSGWAGFCGLPVIPLGAPFYKSLFQGSDRCAPRRLGLQPGRADVTPFTRSIIRLENQSYILDHASEDRPRRDCGPRGGRARPAAHPQCRL